MRGRDRDRVGDRSTEKDDETDRQMMDTGDVSLRERREYVEGRKIGKKPVKMK